MYTIEIEYLATKTTGMLYAVLKCTSCDENTEFHNKFIFSKEETYKDTIETSQVRAGIDGLDKLKMNVGVILLEAKSLIEGRRYVEHFEVFKLSKDI